MWPENHGDNRFRNQDQFVIGSTQSNNSFRGVWSKELLSACIPPPRKADLITEQPLSGQSFPKSDYRRATGRRPSRRVSTGLSFLVWSNRGTRHLGFRCAPNATNQNSRSGSRRSNGTSMDENPCATQHRSGPPCRIKVDASQCSRTTGSPSNRCQHNCRPDHIDK